MYSIQLIEDSVLKQDIAQKILNDLPEWFGIPESTKHYIDTVVNYDFIAAFDNDTPIGFYSVRHENKDVLDMYVLGALKAYHNKGVGYKLQSFVNEYAIEKGYKYLMVLTLAKKANSEEYLLTRKFYLNQGFTDFYQNDDIFDKFNPCQIMMKVL